MSETKLKKGQKRENWKEDCEKFPEYYKKRHPEWSDEQCKEESRKFCRSINWQCIEYYEKKYPGKTEEEYKQMIIDKKKEKESNSKYNIEYYKKHYPELSIEEMQEKCERYTKERNAQCIEFYERKYPNKTHEEHLEMLRQTNIRMAKTKYIMYGENNPAHHSKTTELQRKQRSPMCIEFYEKKYPNKTHEEHLELLEKHRRLAYENNPKELNPLCNEYYISRGYTLEEARKIIKIEGQKRAFTLEKCIERYGEEEGIKRFNERQKKWMKSLHDAMMARGNTIAQSNISMELFNKLTDLFPNTPHEYEYNIGKYSYDLKLGNKIFEFNGDYWHANPNIYDETFINKVSQKTAREIWNKDIDKIKTAEKAGFKVMTIWESDYKDNPAIVIKKCLQFIYDE